MKPVIPEIYLTKSQRGYKSKDIPNHSSQKFITQSVERTP